MDAVKPASRHRLTQAQLLRLAWHYQDLARRHHDEEHFWLSRASYFGRRSGNP